MIAKLAQSIESTEKEIGSKEAIAISLACKTGAVLAKEIPKIADDYRNGMFGSEIVVKYNIASKFGLKFEIAKRAVYHAIKILLTKEERSQISKIRTIEAGKKGGAITRDKHLGIHGLSPKEQQKNASNAGKKGGKTTHEKGVGVFALSHEEKVRCGIKGVLAVGDTPWASEEEEYCIYLSKQQEFLHINGHHTGKPSAAKIAAKLNEIFHAGKSIRTDHAVNSLFQRNRKK